MKNPARGSGVEFFHKINNDWKILFKTSNVSCSVVFKLLSSFLTKFTFDSNCWLLLM